MGFLNSLLRPREQRGYGDISDLKNPSRWLLGYVSALSAAGIAVTPDTAMRATANFRAIRLYAKSIAVPPLNVYKHLKDGSKVIDRKHWAYQLLHNRPNSEMDSFQFRQLLEGHRCVRGNAYFQKIRDGLLDVRELVPLNPDRIRIERDTNDALIYIYRSKDGSEERLKKDRVVHLKAFGTDGVYGLSPVRVAMDSIGLTMAAEQYGARFFSQNAVPNGYFKHPGAMGQAAIDTFTAQMEQFHAGLNNAHKFAVLEEGMDFVSIGMKHEEAQFMELRKFQIPEIARIWELPPHKLGDLERATFSNIEEQNIDFYSDSLLPVFTAWEQALTTQLLSEKDQESHSIGFVLEGFLRANTESRFKAYSMGRQWGWLSRNDIRERENMPKLPPEIGDTYLDPGNMMVAGEDSMDAETADPADPKPAETPKKRQFQREKLAGKTIFRDVLGRISRKEAQFLTKMARKLEQNAVKGEILDQIDEFYRENEAFVAETVKPAVEAVSVLIGVNRDCEKWAKSYAERYCQTAWNECLLGYGSADELRAIADRWRSEKSLEKLTENAVERVLKGNDDE